MKQKEKWLLDLTAGHPNNNLCSDAYREGWLKGFDFARGKILRELLICPINAALVIIEFLGEQEIDE